MQKGIMILCFWLLSHSAHADDTLRIYFATGKSDAGESTRESVRAFLNQYRNGDSLLVNGYADEPGNTQLNLDLSEQRAEIVARLLRIGGIPATLIKTTGMGRAEGSRGANQNDRRAEIIIRRVCGGSSIKDDKVETYFHFNSTLPDSCVLAAIANMAVLSEQDPMKQLHINLYALCPKCRRDGTIPPDCYHMFETKGVMQQRKEAIGNYLRDKQNKPTKVFYHETVICFKRPNRGLKDKASAAVPFRMQGSLVVSLSER